MIRTTLKECYTNSKKVQKVCNSSLRNQSSSSGKSGGGGGKVVLTLLGAGALATGGVVAYANFDPLFRKSVEKSVPFTDQAFEVILGKSDEPTKVTPAVTVPKKVVLSPPPPPSATKKDVVSEESLLKKKLDRENQKTFVSAPPPPLAPPVPLEKVTSTTVSESKRVPESPKTPEPKKEPAVLKVDVKGGEELKKEEAKPEKNVEKEGETRKKPSDDRKIGSDNMTAEQYEAHYKHNIKLQLAAYEDHLREQLKLQEYELNRRNGLILEEKVLEQKLRYQRELASSITRLQEVERILHVRDKLDHDEKSLRQLWVLCQHLNEVLKSDPTQGIEVDSKKVFTNSVLPVLNEIITKEDTNALVKMVCMSLKDRSEFMERGVYTEDALIHRFNKVETVCKRVAMIGDNGGSLWQYMLSYAQSALMFNYARAIPKEELANEPMNACSLSTLSILARVRYHLDNRNLEQSLKYANQLKGEPRKAAYDWIRDVRTHLELKQAATLIQSEASCVSLKVSL